MVAKYNIQLEKSIIITDKTTPDPIKQWIDYIEQFHPYIHFITGMNVVADTLSHFDCLDKYILSNGDQTLCIKDFLSK